MDAQLMSSNPLFTELKFSNLSCLSAKNNIKTLTSELELEVVVIHPKFMPLDRLSEKVSSLITRNMSMKTPNVKSKILSSNTIELSSLPIPEDVNPRSSVVMVPEPEDKSLTDERGCVQHHSRLAFLLLINLH
jgi:hypothetical protein